MHNQVNLSFACEFLERKFTKKHEWISVDSGVGTIGVSDYAQVGYYSVIIKCN